jgi:hypothetical protein
LLPELPERVADRDALCVLAALRLPDRVRDADEVRDGDVVGHRPILPVLEGDTVIGAVAGPVARSDTDGDGDVDVDKDHV